jgi:hypothetical protein
MNDPNNTNSSDNLDQTDEEILTHTVSDDALEAAAGRSLSPAFTSPAMNVSLCSWLGC